MEAETTTWLGFAGIIVGALLGYGSSMIQETRRRRHEDETTERQRQREDRQRLQDRRFAAYVAMITEANRVYASVRHPDGSDVDVAQVRNAYETFTLTLSPAFMVAPDAASRDVVAAIARVTRQLTQAVIGEDREHEDIDVTLAPLDQLLRDHRRCIKGAEAVMRAELGIVDP
jgi:hypothetical protein